MPVIVQVGLSRKVSRDFQSNGYSLNIHSELPASAVEDPEAMGKATSTLFQLAEDLLEEQVTKAQGQPSQNQTTARRLPARNSAAPVAGNGGQTTRNGNGYRNGDSGSRSQGNTSGNGPGNGHGSAGPVARGITEAQGRAIQGIARQMKEDPDRLSQDEFGLNVRDLSVREASELIDLLKKQIDASASRGVAD